LRGTLPDAADGLISFDLSFEDGVAGRVALPDDLSGEFWWKGARQPLNPGANDIRLP